MGKSGIVDSGDTSVTGFRGIAGLVAQRCWSGLNGVGVAGQFGGETLLERITGLKIHHLDLIQCPLGCLKTTTLL